MYDPAVPFVRQGAVAPGERAALAGSAIVVRREGVALLQLTGPGRVACLQGLVSSDVVQGGAHQFGALLTNKGMILTPLWITQRPDDIMVELPAAALAAVADVLARTLPPRLCRVADVTGATASFAIYGPAAADAVSGAPGTSAPTVARGAAGLDCLVTAADADAFLARVGGAAVAGTAALLEECRILAGIPRLGAEIDEHTLPQEVRLDDLGAVSYTKGCYVGQETVARLHFRGHANRGLALAILDAPPATLPRDLTADGKAAGRLTSVAWADELDAYVGLAVVRREVEDGAEVALEDGVAAVVRRDRWLRVA
jgi:folate-binding protein YgfZ